MERRFAAFVCMVLIFPVLYGSSTVELVQGGEITADIIDENPQRLVVDLGFIVLSVPRAAISRIYRAGNDPRPGEDYGRDLYRVDVGAVTLPIKELAALRSEAVVLVRTPTGQGSGFVIHPDGYVITNDHVIAGEHAISITLFDDGDSAAEMTKVQFDHVRIVAADPDFDLALLKIDEPGDRRLKTAPLGPSSRLRQGQAVFTIGSPLGLERTVSEGIISMRNRLVNGRLLIQTTAQINPGNSGGPLFNMRGEVVGVNNMKVVAQGAEGLGFAIPSHVLKTFLSNRDAFAFDPRNPNSGYRYNSPPRVAGADK